MTQSGVGFGEVYSEGAPYPSKRCRVHTVDGHDACKDWEDVHLPTEREVLTPYGLTTRELGPTYVDSHSVCVAETAFRSCCKPVPNNAFSPTESTSSNHLNVAMNCDGRDQVILFEPSSKYVWPLSL